MKLWTPVLFVCGNLENPGHAFSWCFFLGTFHEFAIRSIERGELWDYRAANMSRKGKKGYITVSADVCAGHFSMDLTHAQVAISPTVGLGWSSGCTDSTAARIV